MHKPAHAYDVYGTAYFSGVKLICGYRFWCLKESYVKATGVGLNLDLQTISFQTSGI